MEMRLGNVFTAYAHMVSENAADYFMKKSHDVADMYL
jgi:hypothetical protein